MKEDTLAIQANIIEQLTPSHFPFCERLPWLVAWHVEQVSDDEARLRTRWEATTAHRPLSYQANEPHREEEANSINRVQTHVFPRCKANVVDIDEGSRRRYICRQCHYTWR